MKRPISLLLMLLLLLLAGALFSGCIGLEGLPDLDLQHTHTLVVDPGYAATCTQAGKTDGTHCSECGLTIQAQKLIFPLGHQTQLVAGKDSTCTEAGLSYGMKCTRCGVMTEEHKVLPLSAHTEIILRGYEATCTEPGLSDGKKCSRCDTVTAEQKEIPPTGHKRVVDAAVEATCKATGLTQGAHCGSCGYVLKAQEVTAKTGHVAEITPAVEPTCQSTGLTEGKHCKYCNRVMVAQKTVAKTDHKVEFVPGVLATETQAGITESTACKFCGKTYIQPQYLSRYNSRYGYDYLGTLENGSALQALYDRLDRFVQSFHVDYTVDAVYDAEDGFYHSEFFTVKDLNVPREQLTVVIKTYFEEHQLYYWYDGYYYYYYESTGFLDRICLRIQGDFANGVARSEENLRIYQTVQQISVSGKSAYDTAKYYHDVILNNMYYAYESDGVTAEDAHWAHSIIGFVEYGTGVCETYAEIFHVLMNYSGVDCIRVQGMAGGGGHAWNLAKMDDGRWYWFDLTWDDYENGYGDTYFCVTDNQKLNSRGETFVSDHTVDGLDPDQRFQYPLPDRSRWEYSA